MQTTRPGRPSIGLSKFPTSKLNFTFSAKFLQAPQDDPDGMPPSGLFGVLRAFSDLAKPEKSDKPCHSANEESFG
jgi:hypothetical protein